MEQRRGYGNHLIPMLEVTMDGPPSWPPRMHCKAICIALEGGERPVKKALLQPGAPMGSKVQQSLSWLSVVVALDATRFSPPSDLRRAGTVNLARRFWLIRMVTKFILLQHTCIECRCGHFRCLREGRRQEDVDVRCFK
ncbi:hypothetical protein F441_06784 [Phytophthora nicotianae CJ01A1]|uniref:Uncharacterized protein n=3 Tax=Phytophthora nicotianae TaxID=4792 RepID=W2RDC8_PHYN3|nr:hypothetical protein PPTG_20981 [Phytophthora nicotianae INRA-310]ETN23241.1 hypothetical protein PPTG_20981 [Phytophthora nicotianae INRA-310]ETO78057.1 hypothetical protein F444_06850 [Phytophthora nicotianae P1976]ETP19099.1 hypothetical protein F441_06784 [Phytophthora nicotianae CJ01A1]